MLSVIYNDACIRNTYLDWLHEAKLLTATRQSRSPEDGVSATLDELRDPEHQVCNAIDKLFAELLQAYWPINTWKDVLTFCLLMAYRLSIYCHELRFQLIQFSQMNISQRWHNGVQIMLVSMKGCHKQ